ncbi:hypothetical protein [Deinococcus yunweiensis]|uniref:hypothetical protein n=1 Tax=Deinococcus yunweiensis TaxID=367282 RepID=UPI00398E8E39
MTTPPTDQISVPLHLDDHQAAQLASVGERLNDLRTWCYAQANGHLRPGMTLAEQAWGAPAASLDTADEVAALRQVRRFASIPAGVLEQTIDDERAAIQDEQQRTGRLRPLSEVWDRYDIDIAGHDWCTVWTPQVITLDGIDRPVAADLAGPAVPAGMRAVWRCDRLAWCAWMGGAEVPVSHRERVVLEVERQRYLDVAAELGPVEAVRDAWAAQPGGVIHGASSSWARVTHTVAGWRLVLRSDA